MPPNGSLKNRGIYLASVVMAAAACQVGIESGSSVHPIESPATLSPAPSLSPLITADDETDFDLRVDPVPSDAPGAVIDAQEAENIARAELVADGDLLMLRHGYGVLESTTPQQTIWIVALQGGEDRPCGPSMDSGAPQVRCVDVYQGVKIDDQTGEVLRHFSTGDQYLVTPEPS